MEDQLEHYSQNFKKSLDFKNELTSVNYQNDSLTLDKQKSDQKVNVNDLFTI